MSTQPPTRAIGAPFAPRERGALKKAVAEVIMGIEEYNVIATRIIFCFLILCPVVWAGENKVKYFVEEGDKFYNEGRIDDAIGLYNRGVLAHPTHPLPHRKLALAYLKLMGKAARAGDMQKALSCKKHLFHEIRILVQINPRDQFVLELMRMVANKGDALASPKKPEAKKLLEQGEKHHAAGEYDKAVEKYKKALELEPGCAALCLLLGDTCYAAGKLTEAESWLKKCIALEPMAYRAYLYLGDTYRKLHKPEDAKYAYLDALRIDPGYHPAWEHLVELGRERRFTVRMPRVTERVRLDPVTRKIIFVGGSAVPEPVRNAWMAYAQAKSRWLSGEKFREAFPGEKNYRPTFEEKKDCFKMLCEVWGDMKARDGSAADSELDLLLSIYNDGFLDAYIYFAHFSRELEKSYESWRQRNPSKMRDFYGRYVILPRVTGKPGEGGTSGK